MAAPKELIRLVERFERNLPSYTSGAYNEAQVRNEFIEPMFELLGWDIHNKAGHAEAYKDVIHEDAIRFGGTTKAPDYCFRIGGTRKFFLEAKKPSISIKDEPTPAYQLRRYAWSAKLSLSILTDFAELALYDCRVKPEPTDKPSTARINYLTYDAYPSKWDEIASVFSKDAVLKGSFDRFAEEKKGKRGTAAVDAEFLKEIERWRELLARNIALRNPRLSIRELNEAVQRTIDRIVFLRICEDRGIETDRQFQLQFLLNGVNTYRRLFELFQRADERYNSGLFHFQKEKGFTEAPDTLTPNLRIDDKVLKDIVGNLYYPDSPYEFSVLPADILGQVYEQFLGKVIRLTESHHAKVEDKPEVKKAGGVYYTPTYIVDYIVEHTVGELLKEKTPKQVAELRILDPACGSGSFLLGAYQRLLDWHRDWYVKDGPEKHTKPRKGGQPALFQAGHGDWRLTTAERKRILLNSIFGVDIDLQAVEVTKLSLLLKVLEGESAQALQTQLKLFHERALPDLASNIKCGNSLVGSDFFQARQGELFDDEETLRVNPFDWDKGFPEIFARDNPGFDAVIGNPPYVKEYTNREPFRQLVASSMGRYYEGKMDIWYAFACLAIDLLRRHGLHGFIATSNWITNAGARILRQKMFGETQMLAYMDFGDFQVFETAGIQTMAYVVKKTGSHHDGAILYSRVTSRHVSAADLAATLRSRSRENGVISSFRAHLAATPNGGPVAFLGDRDTRLLARIEAAGNYRLPPDAVSTGIDVHQDFVTEKHCEVLRDPQVEVGSGVFVLSGAELRGMALSAAEKAIVKPYYTTEELGRYFGNPRNCWWIIYSDRLVMERIGAFPRIKRHFDKLSPIITSDNRPYGLHRPREERFFVGEKIVSLRKTSRPCFTFTDFPCYVSQTFFVLKPEKINLKYLTGLLNSRVCHYWLDRKGKKQGGALQIDKAPLLEIPLVDVESGKKSARGLHDAIVSQVEALLRLGARTVRARTGHESSVLSRQVSSLESRIDRLVYELYGLTDEEIRIVEEATT